MGGEGAQEPESLGGWRAGFGGVDGEHHAWFGGDGEFFVGAGELADLGEVEALGPGAEDVHLVTVVHASSVRRPAGTRGALSGHVIPGTLGTSAAGVPWNRRASAKRRSTDHAWSRPARPRHGRSDRQANR